MYLQRLYFFRRLSSSLSAAAVMVFGRQKDAHAFSLKQHYCCSLLRIRLQWPDWLTRCLVWPAAAIVWLVIMKVCV